MLGFPAYHWSRERRRQGKRPWGAALLGVVVLGVIGAVAVLAFLFVRR
jgi:hypothetical protein